MSQKGLAGIFVIIIVLVIVLLGVILLVKNVSNPDSHMSSGNVVQTESTPSQTQSGEKLVEKGNENPDEPPLKLKSIGVDFSDFKFTKEKLQFNRLFMPFGFVIPGNVTSSGKDKSNPQPTFILPLHTPVRSIVDGVVAAMPTVWSGDYSIQVTASGQMEKWIYETEHVINPKVKVGDKVAAGQIIAEVSNFDKGAPAGYGAVEIGILKGGNPPQHVCPFAYLDDSIKDETLAKIRKLFKDWEEYIGDQTLYDELNPIPGCITLDPIQG